MDEKPVQLLDETIERVKAKPMRTDPDTGLVKPGQLEKIDYHYERCGVASIFVFTEPLAGWRYMEALSRRTKSDFAFMVKKISDTFYPDIDRIILINDNLNTHNISSFYEAFTPETAYLPAGRQVDLPTNLSFITRRSMGLGLMLRSVN